MNNHLKDVLVGTFVETNFVPRRVVKEIVELFETNKIFIFEIENNKEKKFLITFNVLPNESEKFSNFKKKYKNTVTLHRKKEKNVLYTINSLNEIIVKQSGQKNSHFNVRWDEYKNSCILIGDNKQLKILKTRLYDVIEY
jgi:hypothetical protein